MSDGTLSVVVPTWNRRTHLIQCLKSVRAAAPSPGLVEIVVIDDGSDRRGADAADVAPFHARFVSVPHMGLNGARNLGVSQAAAPVLCFLDDDARVPGLYFEAANAALERHPGALVIGGPVGLTLESWPPYICCIAELFETVVDHGPETRYTTELAGCNLLIRREAFEIVGDFIPGMKLYGEETEWLNRLARAVPDSCIYEPSLGVSQYRYRTELTRLRLLRRAFRRGYNLARNNSRHDIGENDPRRHLVISLRSLGHAIKQRCLGGLMSASNHFGSVVGSVTFRGQGVHRGGR